ncbi:hypothetical protein, partial [Klebsiella pneumoniae]|uniref:hypothetical protein n=1 Tax=Klebsiella pneumoniae TaxID=573 RepID=UPI0013D7A88C
ALVAAAQAHEKLKNYEALFACREALPIGEPTRLLVDDLCVGAELVGCEWEAINRRLTGTGNPGAQVTLERAPFSITHLVDDPA